MGSPCNALSPAPGCIQGSFCAGPEIYGPMESNVCTALNSVPSGLELFVSNDTASATFYSASAAAGRLCMSGLGVAVPDGVLGYPSTRVRCVDEVDLSEAGRPCSFCQWAGVPGSALPLSANSALVCAPVAFNATVPCTFLPAALLSTAYLTGMVSLNSCRSAARSPTGMPCPGGRLSVAACASVACWGEQLALSAAVGASSVNVAWQLNFPQLFGPPPSTCYAVAAASAISYQILLGNEACPLTDAFLAAGWNCSNVSAKPTPAPSPSHAPSPSGAFNSITVYVVGKENLLQHIYIVTSS